MRERIRAVARLLLDSRWIRRLGGVLPPWLRGPAASILGRLGDAELDRTLELVARRQHADLLASARRETVAWREVRTRAEWEAFRDVRLDALRRSLGKFPSIPRDLESRTIRTLRCDGFQIDNLVFESRPGLAVTANLYSPEAPQEPTPGILLCHSHHHPKTQDELQTMGATWARCGCVVLVMDQLGHGERRQHDFADRAAHPAPFPVDRQDYFFRYNTGIQLHLIGDSLIGWMVWDLMRGVDLLLSRPGMDPARIVLIGSVAGGGDPAAVAAALDERISAVVPFGFGKASIQRADAREPVNFAGEGSWESTRNLRNSAAAGFAPWLILGAVAGRGLLYAHEFGWDPEQDPVWPRLVKIFELCGAADRLATLHGSGSGRSPEDTHCNNVGAVHRRQIYPVLRRWFGIPLPQRECRPHRAERELLCAPADRSPESSGRPLHRIAAELAGERLARARDRRSGLAGRDLRRTFRDDLSKLLGRFPADGDPRVQSRSLETIRGIRREAFVLETEPGISVPAILLVPNEGRSDGLPLVVGFTQAGSRRMLRDRSTWIGELLRGEVAVCLPDLRGTGDSRVGDEFRGRRSVSTGISSTEMMLGRTLLGARLFDLRRVLQYLRGHSLLDGRRVALWGDSFARPNPDGRNLAVPYDAEPFPTICEPLGGVLALLGGLFEEQVGAVYAAGGLVSFESLLQSPYAYVPHDVIVPGLLEVGDVPDLARALAPLPLRMEALVDGLNRRATAETLVATFGPAREAYGKAGAAADFRAEPRRSGPMDAARWMARSPES